jgi:hypothetical protein
METAMTVDDLVASARRNRTGPLSANPLSHSDLSEFLRFALGYLLKDIDYEADRASGGAIAARTMAAIIAGAEDHPTTRQVQ